MWSGYVYRLALETSTYGAAAAGKESSEQLCEALEGAGDYTARKRVFGLVRWVYDTLRASGMPLGNPTKSLEKLFAPDFRPEHQPLENSWADKMAQAAGHSCKGWKQARLTAIVSVLCETALKNNELVELRLADVGSTKPFRVSAGSRAHAREFELSQSASRNLATWIDVRPDAPSDYLFVADATGRPMDHTTLWRQLKRVTLAIQGPSSVRHFGTGLIRVTKAQELRAKGLDVSQIAEFLGHKQETSTDELLERVSTRQTGRTGRVQDQLF